ncbi:MAG TPA: hypothetical protein VE988_20125 [Gemmataceae bacterium]|nr:hypothetical protein [Gemmataceae bacterium]
MALYFLVLDRLSFQEEILPGLVESWRKRSFAPCKAICAKVLTRAKDFADRYYIVGETLLAQIGKGLPFDRLFWQHLAGELLWYSAVDIPELQTSPDTLARLLAPQPENWANTPREALPPILQAHHGSRDLRIGNTFYRPEQAGWNDPSDVVRLAAYLNSVHPETWQAVDLSCVPEIPGEEREEELAYLRDWFPPLQELYAQAAQRDQVIVCEILE